MSPVRIAASDEEILSCYPVMHQLRTHLREEDFVSRVRYQQSTGYHLAFLEVEQIVRAVAGFRLIENLFTGRVLYVDDLVTDAGMRSAGHGRVLLKWLSDWGRETGCQTLELDSSVQRFDAHRFYLVNRLVISSHHFRLRL